MADRQVTKHAAMLLLLLVVCFLASACAQRPGKDEEKPSGGFYGSLSGGVSRP